MRYAEPAWGIGASGVARAESARQRSGHRPARCSQGRSWPKFEPAAPKSLDHSGERQRSQRQSSYWPIVDADERGDAASKEGPEPLENAHEKCIGRFRQRGPHASRSIGHAKAKSVGEEAKPKPLAHANENERRGWPRGRPCKEATLVLSGALQPRKEGRRVHDERLHEVLVALPHPLQGELVDGPIDGRLRLRADPVHERLDRVLRAGVGR